MSILITPILGAVAVSGQAELNAAAKPAANNTRWMFDVEGSGDAFSVQLLEMRSKKPISPDLVAGSFLPMSAGYHLARPFIQEPENGLLRFCHPGFDPEKGDAFVCRYRVMI